MISLSNLETDIADHCNLKCKHCAHHSPYVKRAFYTTEEFEKDIACASVVMHSNWFKLLGGEPLLNKDLPQYIKLIKQYKISDNVAIFTNGILLDRADAAVFENIDALCVSEYPLTPELNTQIKKNVDNIRNQYPGLIVVHNQYNTFEAQEFTERNIDPKLVREIWNRCKLRFECNVIYKGYFSKCIVSRRKQAFLEVAGCSKEYDSLNTLESDNCNLHADNLRERFLKYYFSDTPLTTCQWCVGSCGKSTPHKQSHPNSIVHCSINNVLDRELLNKPSLISQDNYFHVSAATRKTKYSTVLDNDGIRHIKIDPHT